MLKLILILKITTRALRQPAFAIALLIAACTSKPPKPDGGEPNMTSRAAVVTAAAECAISSAKEFRTAADTMKTAVAAYAAAPDAQTQAAAREAFHAAFDSWQINEQLQFGPAAPSTTPGGNDMRDQIDSWPLVSRCAIEEQLVSKSYESGVRSMLVNRRGMPALEYLLFFEGDDTACSDTSPIVAQGSWATLSSTERASRRRAYAAAVAADVAVWAADLVAQWEGGFKDDMLTAGTGSTLFGTTQAALNVVSDAVFYMDKQVKHAKLRRPLGLEECANPTCPELLESPYARRSKRNIEKNLVGLRRLLRGCEADHSGVGFDDLLTAIGADQVTKQIHEHTDGVQAALSAIEEADLDAALVADKASVLEVHAKVTSLGSLLKTEFLTDLDLELPKTLEGDND